MLCYLCKGEGHLASKCPKKNTKVKGYACGKEGQHMAKECPHITKKHPARTQAKPRNKTRRNQSEIFSLVSTRLYAELIEIGKKLK